MGIPTKRNHTLLIEGVLGEFNSVVLMVMVIVIVVLMILLMTVMIMKTNTVMAMITVTNTIMEKKKKRNIPDVVKNIMIFSKLQIQVKNRKNKEKYGMITSI